MRGSSELFGYMVALRWRKMRGNDRKSIIYLII
jgi:hypothetical protein